MRATEVRPSDVAREKGMANQQILKFRRDEAE
jgi:hypothetical protein